ncbi:hypothetical protein SAMN05421823_104316 [Catalinimonas alkaloidigena]|uniref:LiaF transmembrane domain-containing protein n=1 Tax=Catalinimonas alkaloidigena TaxID=1075417 RepID=A0A1G9H4F5_9BACT|nr:hypothetical protein [Catalinimonas alkaloidigena]SDL07856.1 hypothetical protein SAMN05421823_104316 [Catalinimonas alkaloidigena]
MNYSKHPPPTRLGDILAGLIVLMVGLVLLLDQTGTDLPDWITSWPMIPLTLGLVIGAKTLFKGPPVWMLFTGFGLVYLINWMHPEVQIVKFVWPAVVIAFALWMILGRRRVWRNESEGEHWKHWDKTFREQYEDAGAHRNKQDQLEAISVFGACEMNILSKSWKGGEVVTLFGGAEINLSQADIQGHVYLEVVQIFGGTKLIIPSHWQVISSEMISVFAGIEDKRMLQKPAGLQQEKVLVLSGTAVFAGIELLSYS